MSFSLSLLTLFFLIAISGFFSVSEISLAASSRLRLAQLADKGDPQALKVLRIHEQPGHYFTVVQIGLNSVAILGGVVGEGNLSPYLFALLKGTFHPDTAQTISFILSFIFITSLFIIFSDLFPRRLGMVNPEKMALLVVTPMQFLISVLNPIVWIFSKTTDSIFNLLNLPKIRIDKITSEDILAMTKAGV